LKLSGYGFEEKPNGNRWMEYEAEHPRTSILYFPWKHFPRPIIEKVEYERSRSLGGLQTYFVKRNTSRLKPREKTNLDMWLELLDWSHLHRLHLISPSSETLWKLCDSTLPSLQHVVYSGNYIVDFLANTSSPLTSLSLEQVSLCPPREVISAITKHQGTALQSLKMNYCSPSDGAGMLKYCSKPYLYPPAAFLNSTHFSDLLLACPSIETLIIDLEVKEEWDYNLLDTIVSFPRLT
jgi:hypothetical protein